MYVVLFIILEPHASTNFDHKLIQKEHNLLLSLRANKIKSLNTYDCEVKLYISHSK